MYHLTAVFRVVCMIVPQRLFFLALCAQVTKTRARNTCHLKKSVEVARGSLVVESHEAAFRAAQRLFFPLGRNMKTARRAAQG